MLKSKRLVRMAARQPEVAKTATHAVVAGVPQDRIHVRRFHIIKLLHPILSGIQRAAQTVWAST